MASSPAEITPPSSPEIHKPGGGIHRNRSEAQYPNMSQSTPEISDIMCIGFGPASLAIGIALLETRLPNTPKISFLERQSSFAWHSGMQLPGAKMQISFLKDLATPRNPQSKFTFISYLFAKGRLNTFINLSTFLPTRLEYEDYLRWCASHFEDKVTYNQDVQEVSPAAKDASGRICQWKVISRNTKTGELSIRLARHVVIAAGGKGKLPREFPANHPGVVHSSQYSQRVANALPNLEGAYNIAVIGNGQSAAEIFNELPSRYPNAKVTLIIKQNALRPSDDSPFVNEIFDPDRVDGVFTMDKEARADMIRSDKATNYGVVREGLLEHLYEKLYLQRLKGGEPKLRILGGRKVSKVDVLSDGRLDLALGKGDGDVDEKLVVDAVFVATGYERNAHVGMLAGTRHLLKERDQADQERFPVRRDYGVDFKEGVVARGAGVWLQGCNEGTHGLSDTLLSILAVRGGELVQSIFGDEVLERGFKAKL